MRQAEVAVKRGNFFLKLGEAFRIRAYLVTYVQGQRTRNEFSHLFHVFFLHAASGYGRRTDADAGRFHGRTRVKRDGVLVYGDAYACVDAFVSMIYLYDDQTMKVEFNCEDVIRRALEKYGA